MIHPITIFVIQLSPTSGSVHRHSVQAHTSLVGLQDGPTRKQMFQLPVWAEPNCCLLPNLVWRRVPRAFIWLVPRTWQKEKLGSVLCNTLVRLDFSRDQVVSNLRGLVCSGQKTYCTWWLYSHAASLESFLSKLYWRVMKKFANRIYMSNIKTTNLDKICRNLDKFTSYIWIIQRYTLCRPIGLRMVLAGIQILKAHRENPSSGDVDVWPTYILVQLHSRHWLGDARTGGFWGSGIN